MRRLARLGIWAAAILLLLGAAAGVTVASVEISCVTSAPQQDTSGSQFRIDDADYPRAVGNSYLSYPEWNIVHAYEDLAGVMRLSSESGFEYTSAIGNFWSSLCVATRVASGIGPVSVDQKATNYIIGMSFTVEMALQGAYERTLGALTAWIRGPARTAEDEFALRVADDYAAFLSQTPWYEFPFGRKFYELWSTVPFRFTVRSIERRFALSALYGAKAGYAAVLRYAAGYSPAALKIKSVVAGLDRADLDADPRIRKVRDIQVQSGSPATLIETPRYRAFTEILRGLARRERTVLEIAGNRRILTTVIMPAGRAIEADGVREIFSLPLQARPGWRRVGLDTQVERLAAQIASVEARGATFEHAYDY